MKRLIDMTQNERVAMLNRLRSRLETLKQQHATAMRDERHAAVELTDAQHRREAAEEGIEDIRAALCDFDPRELAIIGIELPEFKD
ncbi:hypothetical protein [Nocardia sp. NPDC057440]|uniref:hypothetical protein n=1 Tax=Nocardia sp. NPDC057440 TaxID=3346134 RepID=UPI00366AE247